eukprot:6459895-Amphidinium_carterae.2
MCTSGLTLQNNACLERSGPMFPLAAWASHPQPLWRIAHIAKGSECGWYTPPESTAKLQSTSEAAVRRVPPASCLPYA